MPQAFPEANPLQMNIFWCPVPANLPGLRRFGLGAAPDPGLVADEEEQEWMTS